MPCFLQLSRSMLVSSFLLCCHWLGQEFLIIVLMAILGSSKKKHVFSPSAENKEPFARPERPWCLTKAGVWWNPESDIKVPSPSLTWKLKMMVSKRNLLFQGVIFRFHVKLWEGMSKVCQSWVEDTTRLFRASGRDSKFPFLHGGYPMDLGLAHARRQSLKREG